MKIAACQLNYTIADFSGNIEKIRNAVTRAYHMGAELAVTSELGVWGYPPQDHLLYPHLIRKSNDLIQELASNLKDVCPVLVGNPIIEDTAYNLPYFNAGLLIHKGEVIVITKKKYLPYYDVFDEPRYFSRGDGPKSFNLNGKKIVLSICEDLWQSNEFKMPETGKIECDGFDVPDADLIINMSASPYYSGKPNIRKNFLERFAQQYGNKILFVNQVGAHDNTIFDGNSCFLNEKGIVTETLKAFGEEVRIIDTNNSGKNTAAETVGLNAPDMVFDAENVHEALVFGIREYCAKNNIKSVCVGVSGGIDSAVVLSLAVSALGKQQVIGVMMPSEFNSTETRADGKSLINNLGVSSFEVSIDNIRKIYNSEMSQIIENTVGSVTLENMQSRIRGTILMAVANQHHAVVLATGNKSELATGYCTIYGDTNGALAVIGDIWKTQVYVLAEYINRQNPVIPATIISRAPSAELRHDQSDSDSLPDYPLLDDVLERIICRLQTSEELIQEGYKPEIVEKISALLHRSEFKRKQLPPVLKVSPRCLTTGRRITVSAQPL